MREIEICSGLAFFLPNKADSHLWFVLSEPENYPEDEIVCVNMTTYDPQRRAEIFNDPSCLLYPGDHPAVSHLSCICYDNFQGEMISHQAFSSRLATSDRSRRYRPHGTNASPLLLQRMRDGAKKTSFLPLGAETILQEQSLI